MRVKPGQVYFWYQGTTYERIFLVLNVNKSGHDTDCIIIYAGPDFSHNNTFGRIFHPQVSNLLDKELI
jgi:hypothetical protein